MTNKSKNKNQSNKLGDRLCVLERRLAAATTSCGSMQPTRQKKKSNSRKRSNAGGGGNMNPPLTGIGQKFFAAQTMPHHESARGCYVPDLTAQPSQKVAVKSRAVFTVPANSQIIVFPNPGIASEFPALYTVSGLTTAFAAANATYTYTSAPAGLVYSTVTLPLPYASSQLISGQVDAQVVSFGMKVRYTGAALNRGGTAIWLYDHTAGGEQILDAAEVSTTPFSTLLTRWSAWPQTRYTNFNSNDTHEFVLCHLGIEGNTGFVATNRDATSNSSKYFSSGAWTGAFGLNTGTGYGNPPAVLVLQNTTAANSLEFTVELIQHMCYTGGTTQLFHSPSPPHLEDTQLVRTSLNHALMTHSSNPDKHIAHHTMDTMQTIRSAAKSMGGALVGAALKEVSQPRNAERLATALGALFL